MQRHNMCIDLVLRRVRVRERLERTCVRVGAYYRVVSCARFSATGARQQPLFADK